MGRSTTLGSLVVGFLIAVAGCLATSEAQATRYDKIDVAVSSLPESAFAYGSYARFTFSLSNQTSSFINNGRFRGTLTAGQFIAASPFTDGSTYSCTISPDRLSVDCTVVAAPMTVVTINLDAKMPSRSATNPVTLVQLDWNMRYGSGDAANFIVSDVTPGAVSPKLYASTGTTETVGGAVKERVFLQTGTGVPRGTSQTDPDPFTASVSFDPVDGTFIVASIKETPKENGSFADTPCNPNAATCVRFSVRNPLRSPPTDTAHYPGDLDDFLFFTIRVDASQVVGKTIAQSYLQYYPDDGTGPYDVLDCPKQAPAPTDRPCIVSKFVWTKSAAQKAGEPELTGDWQHDLRSSGNGYVATSWW